MVYKKGLETLESYAYKYDKNSNITEKTEVNNTTKADAEKVNETKAYTYNALGQLTKTEITYYRDEDKTQTITYEYDKAGNRTKRVKGSAETTYTFNGLDQLLTAIQNLLGLEGNIISAEESKENTASDETGSDSLIYHLHNKDIQGSTTSILDESGAGELSYEYDDFGETEVNGSGTFENEICYTGGIYDDTTGLYYLNARYYDPENGRFLTEDTYRGEEGSIGKWHLYVYCDNNPISYTDPSGYWKKFNDIKKDKSKKAKDVIKRYNGNVERDKGKTYCANTSNFINYQKKLGHIKFRNVDVGGNGCGIIAAHNFMKLKKKSKNFIKLVAEFDYYMLQTGILGIRQAKVKNALKAYGLNVKKRYTAGTFDDAIKKKKYGIVLYAHNKGGHYITVKKSGKYMDLYNYTMEDDSPQETSKSMENWIKSKGYEFLAGYTL